MALHAFKMPSAVKLDLDIAPQAELDTKVEEAIGIYGSLELWVNNAGYMRLVLLRKLDGYYTCEEGTRIFRTTQR